MSHYTADYDPYADANLTPVGCVAADLSYEYDEFHVFKHADGRLLWEITSGCSCSYPFEDCTSSDEFTPATAQEIHAALDKWAAYSYREVSLGEVADLHAKIASA